jgi:hypothetical protein
MRFAVHTLALTAAFSVNFCVPRAIAIQPADNSSICVISHVGKRLETQTIGSTLVPNKIVNITNHDWKIDDLVYDKIRKITAGKYRLQAIAVPDGSFDSVYASGGFFRNREEESKVIVQKLTSSKNCDYYLEVAPGTSRFSTGDSYVFGLGVVEFWSIFFSTRHLHAFSYLRLYDGKTFDVINYKHGLADEKHRFPTLQGPVQDIEMDDDQSLEAIIAASGTRDSIWAMLETSLELSVPELLEYEKPAPATPAPASKSKKSVAPISDGWPRN